MIRKKRDLSPDAKLRFPDYLGYFFGAGTNIAGYIVSAFLLIYYSNVLYLGLTQVGVVMAISKCFDGVSDILMGRIIDKTKSKYGKARPWYLRMILPLSMCMLFLFWMPPGLSETWKYVYVFITYNLASTVCFTANAIAHSSMIGFMTMDTRSRGIVGVMSMISNTVFTIVVTNFFMKICKFFGGGETYTQRGFTLTILVYLVFYAAAAVLAFLLTRERIHNVSDSESRETKDTLTEQEKEKEETVHQEAEVPFWTAIRSLFTNKYWILCLVMCLGFYFLMSYASSATVYFAQYVMEDISLQGTLASVLYIVLLVGIILALPVMTKIGKRNTMAIGLAISAVGWFLPQITLEKTIVIAASAIVGIGFGFIAAPAGSFLQDTLTYGTWKSGVTAIGMGNAAFSFVNKLSSALGTIILGFVLDAGKFDASLAVQPTSAIHAIKLLYIWMPTVICLVCLGLSVLYDLDKKLPFIEEEIKAGRIGEKRKTN